MGTFDLSGKVAIITGATRDRPGGSRCMSRSKRGGGYFGLHPAAAAAVKRTTSLGRLREAEAIAGTAASLAAKADSRITGQRFTTDGDMTIASSI